MRYGYGYRYSQRWRRRGGASAPSFGALTLAASSIVENSAAGTVVGGILGKTDGSTLALTDDAGGRFSISGTNIVAGATPTDYETATSHDITIRESKAGYTDRSTTLTITVANAYEQPDLGALGLSATTFVIGTPASGAITGATAGSTISATGLPDGLTIDGPARTWAWSGTGTANTGNLTLTETLADSSNSPRDSVIAWTVAEESFPTNMRYSMNLQRHSYYTRDRPFSNVLLAGEWNYPVNNKTGVISDTLMGRDGELIPGNALPADVTRAGMVYPVNTTMVLYWEGPSSGVTPENSGGSVVSGVGSPVASGSGYKIEFTLNNPNWSGLGGYNWRIRCSASTVGTNLPTRVFCCEKSLFDAHGGDIDAIPRWHPDYVAALAADDFDETIRFMDLMETNTQWSHSIAWSERAQVNYSACRREQRAFVVFPAASANDADALVFSARDYFASPAAYTAARISAGLSPEGPGAEYGNLIAITVNAPSGAGDMEIVDNVDGEISIIFTPPTGVETAAQIATWYTNAVKKPEDGGVPVGDSDTIKGWIQLGGAPLGWNNSNTGTSAIGAHAKTFMTGGRRGDAPDGIPLEWMLDLADQLGKSPYFNLPYRADDTFSQNFAAMVAAKGLAKPAYYARGNEVVWNTGFKISSYVNALAQANGNTSWEQRGLDHVAMMAAIRLGDPNAIRVLESQNFTSDMSPMLATTGVPAAVDHGHTAPYFGYSGIIDDAETDLDVIFERLFASIPAPITSALAVRDALEALGKTYGTYEGGQHVVSYNSDRPTLMESIERDPRMERATSIYFSEVNRRVAEGAAAPLNYNYWQWAAHIDGWKAGAFGMREYQGQADADAPKARAYFRAKQGLFDPYLELGESLAVPTTPIYVGSPVTLTIPTAYNAVSTAIQCMADGVDIAGATSATYTPTSGELGKKLSWNVTLTNGEGRSWTYTSPETSAVMVETKFMIVTLTNGKISGGNITLPADWSDSNTIHCFGRGGKGVKSTATSQNRSGGGGGAYAGSTITGLLGGASIPVQIGDADNAVTTSFNSGAVVADYGRNGVDTTTGGGVGGLAANSIGDVTYDGGDGGSSGGGYRGGCGGGGAAGPNGAGADGGGGGGGEGKGGGGANGGAAATNADSYGGEGGNNRFGVGAGLGGNNGRIPTDGENGGGGGGGGGDAGDYYPANQGGADGSMEILWTDSETGEQIGPGAGAGANTNAGGEAGQAPGNAAPGGGAAGGHLFASTPGYGFIVLEWQP